MAQFEPLKTEIEQAGAQLVFVAAQARGRPFDPEQFLRDHPISFPFLLDEDRRVTKAYGVYHLIGLDAINIAHPATFVISKNGKVKYVYVGTSQLDRAPVEGVLGALEAGGRGGTKARRNR